MNKLMTHHGAFLNREHPLNEYPRPHFVRSSYLSLNGPWQLTICRGLNREELVFQGEIIVPFAVESPLSEVPSDRYQPGDLLIYERELVLDIPKNAASFTLHFEGIDYDYQIFLNEELIGAQKGGYEALRINLPVSGLKKKNHLRVEVFDDTHNNYAEKGKQSLTPGGMWYTPTSGIYQSVWGEFLPRAPIRHFRTSYDFEKEVLTIVIDAEKDSFPIVLSIPRVGKEDILLEIRNPVTEIPFPQTRLWSVDDPFLYDLFLRGETETISGYFGIRQVAIKKRFQYPAVYLNDDPVFLNGLLDQGYWPESGITPPSDEALIDDLMLAKRLGFNTMRVHMKKAPPRYLFHADRLGILVIQDLPAGGRYSYLHQTALPTIGKKRANDGNYRLFGRHDQENRENFYRLLLNMIDEFHYSPSLIIWCPFNEGWGQFDAARAYEMIKKVDPTRLVDTTSGWFDVKKSDFYSVHNYFYKIKVKHLDHRPYFLSEFGGYSYAPEFHTYNPDKVYGYKKFKDAASYEKAIHKLYSEAIIPAISQGLAGAIYTQVSDVEEETNGLISYDRKVLKVNELAFRALMEKVRY
ncbi:MAG: glycoside hydrolase family 2 protein [Bacilli bacterium]|jgi:beta-galactosidase/beta-glucuronidase